MRLLKKMSSNDPGKFSISLLQYRLGARVAFLHITLGIKFCNVTSFVGSS